MENKRRTIVINKKFQYQYSLFVAALTVLLVNSFLLVRLLFPGEQPLALSTTILMSLGAVEFLLVAVIWYGSLKASHRIAGPVYVFSREIGKLGSGDLTANIRLRNKDMFRSEAEGMNASITALRNRISSVRELSEQLQQKQSAGGDTGDLVQQLCEQMSAFTTATDTGDPK